MMTRYAWAAAEALCLALAGCDHPAESAASTPSGDSFPPRSSKFASEKPQRK